jgi:hypothetical protein
MSRFESIGSDLRSRVRDGLVRTVGRHTGEWVEWGVVEFEYARDHPDDFARVIALRQGHSAQAARNQITKHGHMASWYLANQILTRQKRFAQRRMADCTGAWQVWDPRGEISFWTVSDADPNWEKRVEWSAYCADGNTGLPPGRPPLDYMSYVPDPPATG